MLDRASPSHQSSQCQPKSEQHSFLNSHRLHMEVFSSWFAHILFLSSFLIWKCLSELNAYIQPGSDNSTPLGTCWCTLSSHLWKPTRVFYLCKENTRHCLERTETTGSETQHIGSGTLHSSHSASLCLHGNTQLRSLQLKQRMSCTRCDFVKKKFHQAHLPSSCSQALGWGGRARQRLLFCAVCHCCGWGQSPILRMHTQQ